MNAAAVVSVYGKPLGVGDDDLLALLDTLADDMKDLWTGDMKRAEAMLFGQAHALQAIFTNLARRASSQEYLKQWEAYLRMALKAQNQCRMTLETLATIKNPPVVIARQANINNGGQQQVNNGADTPAPSGQQSTHAANMQAAQTELLEQRHGQGLTLERRVKQAALIRNWKPWAQSTGPRTAEGKAVASRNAFKGGHRAKLRELARELDAVLCEQRNALRRRL